MASAEDKLKDELDSLRWKLSVAEKHKETALRKHKGAYRCLVSKLDTANRKLEDTQKENIEIRHQLLMELRLEKNRVAALIAELGAKEARKVLDSVTARESEEHSLNDAWRFANET